MAGAVARAAARKQTNRSLRLTTALELISVLAERFSAAFAVNPWYRQPLPQCPPRRGLLRSEVADCYCCHDGRPGIDPEVAIRLMLAGLLTSMSISPFAGLLAMRLTRICLIIRA